LTPVAIGKNLQSMTLAENLPPVSTIPGSTTAAKLVAKFSAGIVDTGAKFDAGVVETGGNLAAGVIETGGKFAVHLSITET
jgi:hypothetical protein